MNHLPEHFKVRIVGDDAFITPLKWINDEEGNACPVLLGRFRLDDGGPIDAYAKLMPLHTPQGQVECINEISGWLLGKEAGLPMAETAFLAAIPFKRLPASQRFTINAGPDDELFFFCTEAVSRTQAHAVLLNDELAKEQSQWPHCSAAIGFDEWTGNPDRHLKNLIRRGKSDFVLIDHGQLLRRHDTPPWWMQHELERLHSHSFNNLLHYHAYTCQSVTRPEALHKGYLETTEITAQQGQNMRRALHEISYWCSLIAPGQSADWLHFLHHRVLNADGLLKKRFGQLPF